MHPATNPFGGPTPLTDKRLGNAYPVVKAVYESLQQIAYVADHLGELQPKDIELQGSGSFIQWRYVGDTDWVNLVDVFNGGTATLVNGSALVPATSVTAASRIMLSLNTPAGDPGILYAKTADIVPGVAFKISSLSGEDHSTVNWWIVNQ